MTCWRHWLVAGFLVFIAPRSAFPQEGIPPNSSNATVVEVTPTLGAKDEGSRAEASPVATAVRRQGASETGSREPPGQCTRAALRAIAFLLAFLTVVGVWKIPPSRTRLTGAQGVQTAPGSSDAKRDSGTTKDDASPFASNFGRTVIAGLGGVAGIELLGNLLKAEPDFNPRMFYIFWYVVFFLLILFLSSLMRAWAESLRSRIAAAEEPLIPRSRLSPPTGKEPQENVSKGPPQIEAEWREREKAQQKLDGQRRRRRSRLVFFDTLFNVMQGNNQLQTAVLGDTIFDLQRSLQNTADRFRRGLYPAMRKALQDKQGQLRALKENEPTKFEKDPLRFLESCDIDDRAVRVSITILSPDGGSLSYLAPDPGSLLWYFDRRSVAWVSVHSGRALWWKKSYADAANAKEIVLFDNTSRLLPDCPDELKLADYFQKRQSRDYNAFLVLPIPWFRRGTASRYRWGGLHISFREEVFLNALIKGSLDEASETGSLKPYYEEAWQTLLAKKGSISIEDDALREALLQAIDILSELLRYYNEEVLAFGNRCTNDAR